MLYVLRFRRVSIHFGDETEYKKFCLDNEKDAIYLWYFTDLEDFSNLQK